jgi:serine/threonine protein kinase
LEGQTVSHYLILEKIGQGGMGEVYLAEDISLERKVALKFLPAGLQADPVARKRFVREAKSAAAIEHPFICNIKEVAQTEGGEAVQVTEKGGVNAQESLDGEILYYKSDDTLWKLPVSGGEETQILDIKMQMGPIAGTSTGSYFMPPRSLASLTTISPLVLYHG